MNARRTRKGVLSIQGTQEGDRNVQHNYFAPVTTNLFAGQFERLQDVCFDPAVLERDLDLARFTGREWLIQRIDEFIEMRHRGYVVVLAEAGVGKSSLAAHLVWTRPWLHHFTRLPGGRSPEAARKSLAAQLIAKWKLKDFAPEGILPGSADRPDWFDRVLRASALRRDETNPGEAIVLVIDGLDEAEPGVRGDTGLPLDLPTSMPDGVFIVATSRFGIDRALHAVRNPADWLQIEVEGTGNLEDMQRFIKEITDRETGDPQIMRALSDGGVHPAWFRRTLAERCAGVWIYLRYVLDEIRSGRRDPRRVDHLPSDLAGYYAEQIERWRGNPADRRSYDQWCGIYLPLLGVLGVARAPLTVVELASFTDVPLEATRAFLDETARAFLNRHDDRVGLPRYALRHQSLRDLLTGIFPEGRLDLHGLAGIFADQARTSSSTIAAALIPVGRTDEPSWHDMSSYAKNYLAAHAAECGLLDDLASDPGFLTACSPDAVLTNRGCLLTQEGRRALAAFELTLNEWETGTHADRIERLALNAARMRAAALVDACAKLTTMEWPLRWGAWSGHGHRTLTGHYDEVIAVAIGRAGKRDVIVSGAYDGTILVWDAVTGNKIGEPIHAPQPLSSVTIGPAGGRDVIVASSDTTVWDAVALTPLYQLLIDKDDEITGGTDEEIDEGVLAVAIGRAGNRDIIVTGSDDSTVRIWDAVTGEPVSCPLNGHNKSVRSVAIGRTGNHEIIVTGSDDSTVRIWDAVTGDAVGQPLSLGKDSIEAVAIGQAGDRDVIVANSGMTVWDAAAPELFGHLLTSQDSVQAVAIGRAGDRDVIATGSYSGAVQVWDAVTRDHLGEPMIGHSELVSAVAIGRAGDRDVVVSGSADGTVRIWDVVSAYSPVQSPASHGGDVNAVAIGLAGSRAVIVSGSDDGTVRTWDAATGDSITRIQVNPPHSVRAVAIGRAGDRDVIVSGSDDGTVRTWDAATGEPIGKPLTGHTNWVRTVAIGRAGDRDVIVSGSDDGTVRTWDAATGEPIGKPLTGHTNWVYSLAVGRAGDRDVIVSGSSDGAIRTWDAATGEPIGKSMGGGSPVYAVAIGRAGDRDVIVSGSDDGTVGIRDAATRDLIGRPLTGHRKEIHAVAIGRAGDRDVIVSGSDDGTVRIWDAATRDLIGHPLTGPEGCVNAVAIGQAGEKDVLVTGSSDRTVFLREHYSRRILTNTAV